METFVVDLETTLVTFLKYERTKLRKKKIFLHLYNTHTNTFFYISTSHTPHTHTHTVNTHTVSVCEVMRSVLGRRKTIGVLNTIGKVCVML